MLLFLARKRRVATGRRRWRRAFYDERLLRGSMQSDGNSQKYCAAAGPSGCHGIPKIFTLALFLLYLRSAMSRARGNTFYGQENAAARADAARDAENLRRLLRSVFYRRYTV